MKSKRLCTLLLALLVLLPALTGAAWPPCKPAALVVAHRGANLHAPENTLPAFEKALALGAHGVETDIYLTADGVVVLSHDSTIDRCSNGTGRVAEMTLAQLREYDFGSWFGEDFAGTPIPTLAEFLDAVQGCELILIELKTNDRDIAAQAVAMVKQRGLMGKTIFQSFDMAAIQACKAAGAEAYIALLYSPGTDYDRALRADAKAFCEQYNLDGLHPQYAALHSSLVRKCAKLGVEVRTWTANDWLFLGGGSGQGAAGLITDQIELAQKMLRLPGLVRAFLGLLCDAAYLIAPYVG